MANVRFPPIADIRNRLSYSPCDDISELPLKEGGSRIGVRDVLRYAVFDKLNGYSA